MAARDTGPGPRLLEVLEVLEVEEVEDVTKSPQDEISYRDLSVVEGKVTSDSGR